MRGGMYKLRKAPRRNLYWVVGEDGTKHSKDPIPKERAEAQMRALYMAMRKEEKRGGIIDRAEFEKRKAKGVYHIPMDLTYDEFARRENEAKAAREADLAKLEESNKRYFETHGPLMACNLTADLKPGRDVVSKAECFRRHQALDDERNPSNKIFRPIMKGVVSAAEALKDFAPPGIKEIGEAAIQHAKMRGYGSTYRKKVLKMWDLEDKPYSLEELAEATHVPMDILQSVYNRGIGAARTQPTSVRLKGSFVKNVKAPKSAKLSDEQWAMARVYSFLAGNPKHDNDLRRNLEGKGFLSNVVRSGVSAVKKVVGRVRDVARGVRLDYPPNVRNTLALVGNLPIIQMYVRRDPIRGILATAINAFTMGSWNAALRKYAVDKLFHLSLEVVVKLGEGREVRRYTVEKNQVINIAPASPTSEDTEMLEVPMSEGTTINSLLEGGKRVLGPNFFTYEAFQNNCADFIIALLQGSDYLTPALYKWLKQPVEQLLPDLPGYTRKLAKLATDAGAVMDVVLKGRGGLVPSVAFEKQLKAAGIDPAVYLRRAQQKAKRLGLAWKHLGFSDDDKHKLAIPNADGRVVRFGAVGLNDHILYTLMKDPQASQHRRAYRSRATKIRGDWADDEYSPNSLAIGVLW